MMALNRDQQQIKREILEECANMIDRYYYLLKQDDKNAFLLKSLDERIDELIKEQSERILIEGADDSWLSKEIMAVNNRLVQTHIRRRKIGDELDVLRARFGLIAYKI